MLEGVQGSSRAFSWLAHDPRFYSKIPPLSQGSSCHYNSAGAFIVLDSDKQTAIQYQPYKDGTTTKAHKITIGKAGDGTPLVEIKDGDGQYLQFQNKVTVLRGAGNASIALDGGKCNLNGTTSVAGSLTVALGTEPVALAPEILGILSALDVCLNAIAAATTVSTAPAVAAYQAATAGLRAALASKTLKAL